MLYSLSVSRVGLLWLLDESFKDDSFHHTLVVAQRVLLRYFL